MKLAQILMILLLLYTLAPAWTTPINLGSAVNTAYSELTPTFCATSNDLCFVSNRAGGLGMWDVWQTLRSGGAWGTPTHLPAPINTEYRELSPFYYAGSTPELYLHTDRPGGSGQCDIWSSSQSGTSWSAPQNLGTLINTELWDVDPCIINSPKRMFFASQGQSPTLGQYEIYYSDFNGSVWQAPVHLDAPVNSTYNDVGVIVTSDGNTMYFHSDRPGGYGGYDLYKATCAGGVWGNVVNMGASINTASNELDPCLSPDEREMVFTSDRTDGYGAQDLWSITTLENIECITLGRLKAVYQ